VQALFVEDRRRLKGDAGGGLTADGGITGSSRKGGTLGVSLGVGHAEHSPPAALIDVDDDDDEKSGGNAGGQSSGGLRRSGVLPDDEGEDDDGDDGLPPDVPSVENFFRYFFRTVQAGVEIDDE
jgi:hypothetical protein